MTTARLPVFPLNTVLFPGRALPLRVFESRYHAMLDEITAEGGSGAFVVAATEDPEVGRDAEPARVGTIARIEQLTPPDRVRWLLARGGERVRLNALDRSRTFLQARVTTLPEEVGDQALARAREVAQLLMRFQNVLDDDLDERAQNPRRFSYCVAHALPIPLEARQALLECPTAAARLQAEARLIARSAADWEARMRARAGVWN